MSGGFFAGINGEELSCPFDKRRNGIILSEGAAVIVIEDEDYAQKRNTNIYAEVKGIGNCFDAYKMGKYQPEAHGLKESIKEAIKSSELAIADIDYISASANSVPEQDRLETKAIKDVLKEITTTLNPHIPRASREAQLLIMAHMQKDELWLITNQNRRVEVFPKECEKIS